MSRILLRGDNFLEKFVPLFKKKHFRFQQTGDAIRQFQTSLTTFLGVPRFKVGFKVSDFNLNCVLDNYTSNLQIRTIFIAQQQKQPFFFFYVTKILQSKSLSHKICHNFPQQI
eukprot:TRINITY_DN13539_c1_g1_i12.p3 TRINITY_DN13539_c1_g1~~TRINITY_DN13539_c1_g1_i12.p3  ORF type:complete len:113 (+),score=0.75 TRINITY_DN13539_c1_g1_i12:182-520(+)